MTPTQVQARRAATSLGSPAALARALGVSRTYVGNLMGGKQQGGIKTTLRLARINREDPIEALRDAGHTAVADELAPFMGKATLTAEQRGILDDLAALDEVERGYFLGLLRSRAKKRRTKR